MAKAKNELEGQVARLEGKLDTEARSKVAAIERVRALENGVSISAVHSSSNLDGIADQGSRISPWGL